MEMAPGNSMLAIKSLSDTVLSRRPDDKNWAAKEIICHMRDTEEQFMNRFQNIIAADEPKLVAAQADRWAATGSIFATTDSKLWRLLKAKKRILEFLRALKPSSGTARGAPYAGRMSIKDFVAIMAGHDENHLEQLKRALAGQP